MFYDEDPDFNDIGGLYFRRCEPESVEDFVSRVRGEKVHGGNKETMRARRWEDERVARLKALHERGIRPTAIVRCDEIGHECFAFVLHLDDVTAEVQALGKYWSHHYVSAGDLVAAPEYKPTPRDEEWLAWAKGRY